MRAIETGRRGNRGSRRWACRAAAPLLALGSPAASHAQVDDEALYKQRIAQSRGPGGELASYDTLEPVRGASRPRPLPVALPDRRSISAAALADAQAYAAANNSSALLIWQGGALQVAQYWGSSPDQPLVSKSLAKPLAALAVGRAIALGKIRSVDQPASDFLVRWKGTAKATITIRQLLNLTSGLGSRVRGMSDEAIMRAHAHPEFGRILVDEYPLFDKPGERYDYSNASFDLIAPLIEQATGRRYPEFIGSEILQPIGATGGTVWVGKPGGTAHAGCCTMLPAETWLRIALLIKQDGRTGDRRLLPSGYVADMRRPTPQNPHFGLGLWVGGPYIRRRGFQNPSAPGPTVLHAEPYLASDVALFDGNANQVIYIVPSADLIVLRTGNSPPRDPEWDNSRLINTVLRGIDPRRLPRPLVPQPR